MPSNTLSNPMNGELRNEFHHSVREVRKDCPTYWGRIQRFRELGPDYTNVLIQEVNEAFSSLAKVRGEFRWKENHATPPMTFAIAFRAHLIAKSRSEGIRVKGHPHVALVMGSTVGLVPTALWGGARAVSRTALFILGGEIYRAYKGSHYRYGASVEVKNELKGCGREWVDVGMIGITELLSLAKILNADAFDRTMWRVAEYYIKRVDEVNQQCKEVKEHISNWKEERNLENERWEEGLPPPVFDASEESE